MVEKETQPAKPHLARPWFLGSPTRTTADALTEALNSGQDLLLAGHVNEGMALLIDRLSKSRHASNPVEWDAVVEAQVLKHPISRLIWQDPLTDHSYRRPRGYPCDASLLDYIYGVRPAPADTSSLGASILRVNLDRQFAASCRARLNVIAKTIDAVAEARPNPRILSIACGHLRETRLSQAVLGGRIGEFLALDQDEESLTEVRRTYPGKGLQTIKQSVRSIVAETARFDNLDLVYATGLYDYLSDRLASRLTRLMFDMLAPGGRLLVANFGPCPNDIGYMESFLGWKLIYRNVEQMIACGGEISSSEWESHRVFWDEHKAQVILEISKAPQKTMSMAPLLRRDDGDLYAQINLLRQSVPAFETTLDILEDWLNNNAGANAVSVKEIAAASHADPTIIAECLTDLMRRANIEPMFRVDSDPPLVYASIEQIPKEQSDHAVDLIYPLATIIQKVRRPGTRSRTTPKV
jgi:extracellular factor (EF) 3-hydroxypalmitic acid methyl ester biosynthesis protein